MKQRKLGRVRVAAFLRRVLTSLSFEAKSTMLNYESWRHSFMQKRMQLGLWLALLYFISTTIPDVFNFLLNREYDLGWLLTSTAIQLSLLSCWAILRTPLGRRYHSLIFLWGSWSVSLIQEIARTIDHLKFPDHHIHFEYFNWTMAFFSQATMMPLRWPLHLISQLGSLTYFFGANRMLGLEVTQLVEEPVSLLLRLFWICFICNLSVYLYERSRRAEFRASQAMEVAYQKLEAEQERSERLLLNILPRSIAERLKGENRTVIADNFQQVTVLFADLVGFTQLSTQVSPTELVNLLNGIFSVFDQLAKKHELEKIKTIGDAYMVVAGLPEPKTNHAQAIADMALDMQAALNRLNKETGQALSIRIGIHTGPVVAGVIGLNKFAYDLWGDTVNTASRMESHGISGAIQVSSVTYECLKDEYFLAERGQIPIKGKGKMTTYLLLGKQSSESL
ncbi:MAG: adenylate/guanylate cyclase domain-containing protein [Coleofasciculaceae cyanobacterium]